MAAAANGPGSHRTEREAAQRRGRQVGSGAERQRYRAAPIDDRATGSVGQSAAHRRMRVAPRKARPFVPRRRRSFLDSRAPPAPSREPTRRTDRDDRPAEPDRSQAPRRHGRHDPAARHADGRPRDADRRVPAARRRHDPGLPARVGRGRRAPRAVQLPGHRPAPAARGGRRRGPHHDPPRQRRSYSPDLPVTETQAPDPLAALRAFVPRRRVLPTEDMPRFTGGAVGRSRTTPSRRSNRPSLARRRTRSACRWPRSSRPTSSWSSTT